MNYPPRVSVVIPCRNEVQCIEKCLLSIVPQSSVEGGLECIVADGMSSDGTRDVLKRLSMTFSNLVVVDNVRRTTPSGLNAAIRAAQGQIIVRVDAHTEYDGKYIEECVKVLTETNADVVGGPWLARGNTYVSQAIAAAFQCPWVIGGARAHNRAYEGKVDTVYLGCWRKEAFDKYGLFDEEFIRNQDDELSLRIIRMGGIIWQSPRIRSWYCPRSSLSGLARQYMQYGYWKVRVIRKHKEVASWRHPVPAAFVLLLTVLAIAALWTKVAFWLCMGLCGAYGVINALASLASASKGRWRFLPLLPVVILCFHISYGYGFLVGLWNLVGSPSAGRERFSQLTR